MGAVGTSRIFHLGFNVFQWEERGPDQEETDKDTVSNVSNRTPNLRSLCGGTSHLISSLGLRCSAI